ncbi:hypothetical protein ACOSQ3_002622 [Xanthoceras sorbifolium]
MVVVKYLVALLMAVLAISAAAHGAHSGKLRARLLRLVPTGPNPGVPHAANNIDKVPVRPELLLTKPTRSVPSGPDPESPHFANANQEHARESRSKPSGSFGPAPVIVD